MTTISLITHMGQGFDRCCVNTIHQYARTVDCQLPIEGFTLGCNHCMNNLKWTAGAWEIVNPFQQFQNVQTPEAAVARHERADAITDGRFTENLERLNAERSFLPPNTIPCEKCSQRAGLLDTSVGGISVYRCVNDHTSIIDYSREMGKR